MSDLPDSLTTDEGIGVCTLDRLKTAIGYIEPDLIVAALQSQAWDEQQYICHYVPAAILCKDMS